MLMGEKPAFLFPFGWRIIFKMGWSVRKREKGLIWGYRFFGIEKDLAKKYI